MDLLYMFASNFCGFSIVATSVYLICNFVTVFCMTRKGSVVEFHSRPPVRAGGTGGLPPVNFEKQVDFTGKCTNKPQ